MLKSLFKPILTLACFCFFFSKSSIAIAQDANSNHTQLNPFKTSQITVDKFNWEFNKDTEQTDVNLTITNNASLAIKSTTIFLTAQDKNGVMLQSATQTLKQNISDSTVSIKETKAILFKNAYNNTSIYNMFLKQVVVEYTNGSVEVLR